jgi:hypothetical protein
VPLAGFLAEHDIVVDCVLQGTAAPLAFPIEDDLAAFAPGSLIVDVSCDEGMGCSWARPTEFADLITAVRDQVGRVERISYPLGDGWEITHRNLVVDGHLVRLEGFHAMPAHTLTLIGTPQRRLTLLVVAPDTPQDTATTALKTAADPDNTASPGDLLAARSGPPARANG